MESNLSPIGWAIRPLKRYAEFSGRSSRAEFWWFFLFMIILWFVLYFAVLGSVMSAVGASQSGSAPSAGLLGALGGFGILMMLVWLVLLIPSIAVQARRLHDTNRSGWWLGGFYLLYAVYIFLLFGAMGSMMAAAASGVQPDPSQGLGAMFGVTMIVGLAIFVYAIVLLVFYCLPGTKGANRFGPDPYGQDVEQVFA